jgi:hypothetical protein
MFFNKLQTRSFFMRFRVIIMSRSDANRILEYRQTLDHFSARLAVSYFYPLLLLRVSVPGLRSWVTYVATVEYHYSYCPSAVFPATRRYP